MKFKFLFFSIFPLILAGCGETKSLLKGELTSKPPKETQVQTSNDIQSKSIKGQRFDANMLVQDNGGMATFSWKNLQIVPMLKQKIAREALSKYWGIKASEVGAYSMAPVVDDEGEKELSKFFLRFGNTYE